MRIKRGGHRCIRQLLTLGVQANRAEGSSQASDGSAMTRGRPTYFERRSRRGSGAGPGTLSAAPASSWSVALFALTSGLAFWMPARAALANADEPAQPVPPSVSNSLVFGTDADRPGAGVVSVEQVSVGGSVAAATTVGRPRRCAVYPTAVQPAARAGGGAGGSGAAAGSPSPGAPAPVPAEAMVTGQQYLLECRYVDDGSRSYLAPFTHQPGVSGPSAAAIARQVYHEVPLVFPQPHTSPSLDAEQLVGFPIWLWVDSAVWRSFEAHASIAGVSVSVVAQPETVRWTMGDGTTLNCSDGGTAWTADLPDNQQSDCSHVYQFVSDHQPDGRYHASVAVVWSVSWSASTGESGTLPDASRTTTFSLDVTERQAVVTYGD